MDENTKRSIAIDYINEDDPYLVNIIINLAEAEQNNVVDTNYSWQLQQIIDKFRR